jgi:hypothetical protein
VGSNPTLVNYFLAFSFVQCCFVGGEKVSKNTGGAGDVDENANPWNGAGQPH